ncbi:MAG: hypothetical protein JSV12_05500 [Candidatus Bathyarchaeota archaeon]|nr:MAG: hypothetical protein JSV12_05500 [Candidatus Bathyarchaeota archaeon]
MYTAQKWFDDFYNKFTRTRQQNKSFGVELKREEYTRLIMNFLEDLGKHNGFKVKRERLTIDQFWRNEVKGTVALEHEISPRGIYKNELPKLMDIQSHLKVLITYVYNYQFPWEPNLISEKIEKEINLRYVDSFKEFLLLIGTTTRRDDQDRRTFMERESDWFARKFYVGAVKTDILVPSSSRRARKAWKTRKEK